MNKIVLENDNLTKKVIDENIKISFHDNKDSLEVNSLIIDIIGNTTLEIRHTSLLENKINMVLNIGSSVEANILEYSDGVKNKVKVNYNLEENSILDIFKFNNCLGMRELDMVNLNGRNSHINYHLKTIGMAYEKYDLMFYHRNILTEANVDVNGVSMDEGNLTFNVTNVVYKGMTKAVIDQNSRIVILDDNKCQINPNLLIDEFDVAANHSAIIGKFSDEEMFYLNSRGINEGQALNLLIKGFLMKGLKRDIFDENIILNIIDKYWR